MKLAEMTTLRYAGEDKDGEHVWKEHSTIVNIAHIAYVDKSGSGIGYILAFAGGLQEDSDCLHVKDIDALLPYITWKPETIESMEV